jgi:hypothetical protein
MLEGAMKNFPNGSNRIPKDNLTIVVWSERKDLLKTHFKMAVNTVEKVVKRLGLPDDFFMPYDLSHAHYTWLGLEQFKSGAGVFNANALLNDGEIRETTAEGLLRYLEILKTEGNPLLQIRCGGFRKARCLCRGAALQSWDCITGGAEFHSYERTPYQAIIYGSSGGPVMSTGWAVDKQLRLDPQRLVDLRRKALQFNFRDKFEAKLHPDRRDADFYTRIGTFGKFAPSKIEMVLDEAREELNAGAVSDPFPILLSDLYVVYYRNTNLSNIIDQISVEEATKQPSRLGKIWDNWYEAQ